MMSRNINTFRFLQQQTKDHAVVVYGKSYCGKSQKTVQLFKKHFPSLLEDHTAHHHHRNHNTLLVIDLNLVFDGASLERELVQWTKQTTTPMVFVRGTFVGGLEDVTAALESGALEEQLQSAITTPADETTKKTLSITIHVREEEEKKKAAAEQTQQPQVVPAIVEVAEEKKEEESTQASTQQHSIGSHHALMHKMIEHENNQHSVVVWYKASDPNSQEARHLLESEFSNANIAYHNIDAMPDHTLLEEELCHMTGQSSVPAVFVDGLHLGGHEELQAAFESGDLKELLMAGKHL